MLSKMPRTVGRAWRAGRAWSSGCAGYSTSSFDDALLFQGSRGSVPRPSDPTQYTAGSLAVARLAVSGSVPSTVLAMARAAGALGAKNASNMVPMRVPRLLQSVSLEIDTDAEEAPRAEAPVQEGRIPASTHVPPERGGFAAESLLDPDAWVAAHREDAPAPSAAYAPPVERTPPSVSASSQATLTVQCRASANGGASTEALAGCMAASLTLVDMLGADRVHIEEIQAE